MKIQFVCYLLLSSLFFSHPAISQHDHDEGEHTPRGPHNGRLLTGDGVQLELAIVEQGIPPEFHAWVTHAGKAVVDDAELTVSLNRLDGEETHFTFDFKNDFWRGNGIVKEPHSFTVTVNLTVAGKTYHWNWDSFEGRTTIALDMAGKMGITTVIAGGANIHDSEITFGKIAIAPEQISHIRARFPGLITNVNANIGDTVAAGDLLAEIESNDSLRRYTIVAPIAGTITQRHANPGELADEQILFSITNLNTLWAELKIFPQQKSKILPQQKVSIRTDNLFQQGMLDHFVPSMDNHPYIIGRVKLNNSDQRWAPGLLVEGEITVANTEVPLAVDNRALQTFRDWDVVFIQVGEHYEIRPLELGRRDANFTEVLSGLNPGDRYVVGNSFLIKADIEKSSASHDH